MQHLSEGTIHSWLDGALSADEAALVEAHVKECPECAAVVAEARGFIAGASRILTALDNAPRGVIPVAAPKKRIDPMVWRVAATLVVIATGTLVVFRNDGRKAELATSAADTALESGVPGAIAPTAPPSTSIDQAMKATGEATPSIDQTRKASEAAPTVRTEQPFSLPAPIARSLPRAGTTAKTAEKGITADAGAAAQRSAASAAPANQAPTAPPVQAPTTPTAQGSTAAAAPAARSAYSGNALSVMVQPEVQARDNKASARRSGVVPDDQLSLRVVGNPRVLGAKVTLYEVAPGDTVTLREESNLRLESVVVTGAAVAPMTRQSVEKSASPAQAQHADTPVVSAADSQRSVGAAAALARTRSAAAPVTRVEVANGVTTIVWVDAASGNVMKLSGRMSEARLQQIKARIEQDRAAAAAARKNP